MTQKSNIELEKLRLEYHFDNNINFTDRVIRITGTIECDNGFDFLDAALSEMERQSRAAITIKIHSMGGSVYEALAMIGRLRASKCQIVTEGYGCVMSAASLLLAAGDKRRISKYAIFMHHEGSYGLEGRHSEIRQEVEQMEREERLWSEWMGEMTLKGSDFWYQKGKGRNFYLTADECLKLGVVDAVF